MDEPERFLDETWGARCEHEHPAQRARVRPPAFVRDGTTIDPRDLDARGGEFREWVPE